MSSRASRGKRSPGFPERASKIATLAAIAIALPLQLWVDPASGLTVWILAVVGFGVTLFCGQLWEAPTATVVVAVGIVLPAILTAVLHVAALNAFYSVWLAAVVALVVPLTSGTGWPLPRDWRIPIGVWALMLALSWPVMIARETHVRLGTLRDAGALDSWANLNVPQVESWILHVVVAQLVALLWLEWQVRTEDSHRTAHGIWIGASIASLVAVYQGVVDVAFLSGGVWPELHRATGTLLDANAYGTLAAIAGPLAFVSIPRLRLSYERTVQVGVLALNWAGAWMSGSRTALACGVCATAFLGLAMLRGGRRELRSRVMPAWVAGTVLAVLLVAIGVGAIGPLGRITDGLGGGPDASLRQLWSRGGYGTVAMAMLREHPLVGVGVGSFNWMAPDYWRRIADAALPFDNAQNWWRHQLAEFGLMGALPILFWSALILWYVLTRRSPDNAKLEGETMRGLLIGIGAASLVGMPTQNPVVLLTFFYIVARFDRLTRPAVSAQATLSRSPLGQVRKGVWAAGMVLALAYVEGHLLLARGPLSPVERAMSTDRDFVVGTYPPEDAQSSGQFRWTGRQASFLLKAPSRYLVIRYHIEHPDANRDPVNFELATRCQILVNELRNDSGTATVTLELGERQPYMQFDTEVSRTWRPSDFGRSDGRQLGVAIQTRFVTGPEQVEGPTKWVPLLQCGPPI
jgi:O-antigen ligase